MLDLKLMANDNIYTVLHAACSNIKASLDIFSKLIHFGGRVTMSIVWYTPLYKAYDNENNSIDMISKLISLGGTNDG